MNVIVFGVANKHSICWAITEEIVRKGGTPTLVCHPAMRDSVVQLAQSIGSPLVLSCDVSKDEDMDKCFEELGKHGSYHGLVHGIAYSDKNELRGRLVHTSRNNFRTTLDISCYSLLDIAKRSEAILIPNMGSIVTLSFEAARRPYENYNVMGIAKAALEATARGLALDMPHFRVNTISCSPENTLSARGVAGAHAIGAMAEAMSINGARATLKEVASAAWFLLSPASSGMTGQIMMVDRGSSVPGMPPYRNLHSLRRAIDLMRPVVPEAIEQDVVTSLAPGS